MVTTKQLQNIYIKLVIGLIIIVFTITAYTETVPLIQQAGNEINETQVPLSNLYASDNIVMVIIMLSLLLFVIRQTLKTKKWIKRKNVLTNIDGTKVWKKD